jgi:uncharacterized protein (TIGR00369 family)
MAVHQPHDPHFADRVRRSFARQRFMRLIGGSIVAVGPGEVELALPFADELTQQHGFVHGGALASVLDAACGYAASTLMPADAGVLTVEFKVNFLAPARADRFRVFGRVRRAGRTVTFAEGEAIAVTGGSELLVATTQATMICLEGRDGVRH